MSVKEASRLAFLYRPEQGVQFEANDDDFVRCPECGLL